MTDYKEVVSNWYKATKIGDFMEGTLISKTMKDGIDPQGRPQTQEIYELLTDDGKFHNLIKKGAQKVIDDKNPIIIPKGEYYQYAKGSVVSAMKRIKIGQKVKFIFDSTIESKDKMKNDFKLVKVYAGEMDEEYLKEQWGEVGEPEKVADETPKDDIEEIDVDKAFE